MAISDLHSDILNNILVRLPPEYLGQLKCVSKSLNVVISCYEFLKSSLNHSPIVHKPNVLLHTRTEVYLVEFSINGDIVDLKEEDFNYRSKQIHSLPELLDEKRFISRILGSCRGLLCLLLSPASSVHGSDCVIALCNPVTKSSWDLPGNQLTRQSLKLLNGFGYDDLNDDYKVVIINPKSCECEAYSLKLNSWSKVCLDYDEFRAGYWTVNEFRFQADGLLLNSVLHWIIYQSSGPLILAIDLRTYQSKILPMPVDLGKTCILKLTVLGGSLVLSNNRSDLYDLWVMKDYGEKDSWMRLATRHRSSIGSRLTPLALLEDNNHQSLLISCDHEFDWDTMQFLVLELTYLGTHHVESSIRIQVPCGFDVGNPRQLQFVGSIVQPYPPFVGDEKIISQNMVPRAYDEFHILVNGVSIDSQLSQPQRRKYFDLCYISNSFLHERLVPGVNSELAARIIVKTVDVAESFASCEYSIISRKDITEWRKALRSLELLGMNVGYLRELLRLASEANDYRELKSKTTEFEKEIESIQNKLVELKVARDNYAVVADAMEPLVESSKLAFKSKLQEMEANDPKSYSKYEEVLVQRKKKYDDDFPPLGSGIGSPPPNQ